ncbi:GTP 3',8-cyclase MoaA [Seminibacterium arietis]|uniref:GTP 3',8-cyclase n=1 Tax=Seminibacterium arietis TaxID=1173502 RepID=A0ABW3I7C7_9PAST
MQQPIFVKNISEDRLIDSFQREYHYLRLSITEACNFRCNYCLPQGYKCTTNRPHFLDIDEIRRLVNGFAEFGTKKIRITGGEPTLRKDFLSIVETVAQQEQIKQIALTTNGYRMATQVSDWQQAGITSINVSVDSLDPKMFHAITGTNRFNDVMQGIERAFTVGYKKVKVNSVLMKNLNDKDFDSFLAWIKDQPIQMRFIELMQTNDMKEFFEKYHLSGKVLEQKLLHTGWQLQPKLPLDGPAKIFRHSDYVGEIGLIMPYERHFCANCNRLRVSATGKLHLCLFGEEGIDLRDLLYSDQQLPLLKARIFASLQNKKEHHFLHNGNSGIRNHLAAIGG